MARRVGSARRALRAGRSCHRSRRRCPRGSRRRSRTARAADDGSQALTGASAAFRARRGRAPRRARARQGSGFGAGGSAGAGAPGPAAHEVCLGAASGADAPAPPVSRRRLWWRAPAPARQVLEVDSHGWPSGGWPVSKRLRLEDAHARLARIAESAPPCGTGVADREPRGREARRRCSRGSLRNTRGHDNATLTRWLAPRADSRPRSTDDVGEVVAHATAPGAPTPGPRGWPRQDSSVGYGQRVGGPARGRRRPSSAAMKAQESPRCGGRDGARQEHAPPPARCHPGGRISVDGERGLWGPAGKGSLEPQPLRASAPRRSRVRPVSRKLIVSSLEAAAHAHVSVPMPLLAKCARSRASS